MTIEPVAPDTNLLRQPNTRRYITAMESARNRRVIILPTVDRELQRHLPAQMGEYLDGMAKQNDKTDHPRLGDAKALGGEAAGTWWASERGRNSSVYRFVSERQGHEYARTIARLPSEAFTDKNTNDKSIYAEAIVHGANVLSTRNRKSILEEVLTEHFQRERNAAAPVALRNLWQQTVVVAKAEGRNIGEVALETALCAVIPEAWEPTTEKALEVSKSVTMFTEGLRVEEDKNKDIDPEREKLVHMVTTYRDGLSAEQFIARCEAAYAIRPEAARTSEMLYHEQTRAAVRRTGLNFR